MPRLFVNADLSSGAAVTLDAGQIHFLADVMRLNSGAAVTVFNGRDGEFAARLAETGKRQVRLEIEGRIRAQSYPPDLWLLFSPLKRQATDWLVEKATELGARVLAPVMMRRTVAEHVRTDRLAAVAREAAEQTERLDLPEVRGAVPLAKALAAWDAGRPLIYCDEQGEAPPALEALRAVRANRLALLIGPEGGFEREERAALRGHDFVIPVSLGPRILRAETAATAALALIESVWGDWR